MPFVKLSDLQGFQFEDLKKELGLGTDEDVLSLLITEHRERYR